MGKRIGKYKVTNRESTISIVDGGTISGDVDLGGNQIAGSKIEVKTGDVGTLAAGDSGALVSLSGGGDEGIMNYEMLNHGKINWIDYKFQALWGYEIAFKYSFLYKHLNNKKLVRLCVEDSLSDNYFVHYAGGWDEFKVWKMKNIFSNKKLLNENKKFFNYLKTKVTGKPRGRILPKTK